MGNLENHMEDVMALDVNTIKLLLEFIDLQEKRLDLINRERLLYFQQVIVVTKLAGQNGELPAELQSKLTNVMQGMADIQAGKYKPK